MRTTWGLSELKDNVTPRNALAVDRLLAAGVVLFGKTNVPSWLADWQSFNPVYGTTNNPWDVTRTPGGSSGGSAAALAAGLTGFEAVRDISSDVRNFWASRRGSWPNPSLTHMATSWREPLHRATPIGAPGDHAASLAQPY